MALRIVTDSTCDLPRELIERHRITVIPMYVHIGDQSLRDGVELGRQEFYERLPESKPAPTTAAPGPEVFRQVYEQLAAEDATEILSIHLSVKLSAVYTIAARAAAETYAVPVTAFDSRQLSLGTGFQALAAAQAAEAGRSMSEILSMLEDLIPRIRVFAALDTLEFLRRSGRMNSVLSFLGTLLHVKPLMKMHDGNATAERVRTRDRAVQRLIELLQEAGALEKVALLHSAAADRAQALLQRVRPILPAGDILVEEINPTLGAHVGPGVIGFATVSRN
jgi:DegV family protein with EDD domain